MKGTAYSGRVPLGPDPQHAAAALAQLEALRIAVTEAEDDVLACLVVTGEPRPQRVLDDWLDQVVDTARALGEQAADLSPGLARHTDAFQTTDPATGSASDQAPPASRLPGSGHQWNRG